MKHRLRRKNLLFNPNTNARSGTFSEKKNIFKNSNNSNNNNSCLTQACPFLCVVLSVWWPASSPVQKLHSEGGSDLRHERMTVAIALAESTHHSSRGQTIARAGVWERDELHGHDPEPPHTPAGALQPLRRRARRSAAGPAVCRVRTARATSAAHRGPDRRRRSLVTDARCSCAADGGTAAAMRLCLLPSRL